MTANNKIIPEKDMLSEPERLRLENAFGEALGNLPTKEETNEAWKHFSDRINTRKRHRTVWIWTSIAVAATITLILCIVPLQRIIGPQDSTALFTSIDSPAQMSTSVRGNNIIFSTPAAFTATLQLSDGTTVLLNANSRIEYPKTFPASGTRNVSLYGQARFKVAKDRKRPFIVVAGDMRTRVSGTVFDINAYSSDEISVTLFQGKVQVSNTKQDSFQDMVPGQKAVLNNQGLTVSRTNLATAGNWISGAFEFDDVPLNEALKTIGAWYNADVVCYSPKLLSARIHFIFPKDKYIQTVITALNDLGIAKFSYSKGRIEVHPVH